MKPQDFLDWTAKTGLTSAKLVAEAMGASRNKVQLWFNAAEDGEEVPMKRVDALAMSAIRHNLPEWGKPYDQ